jgi:hypothetical protein
VFESVILPPKQTPDAPVTGVVTGNGFTVATVMMVVLQPNPFVILKVILAVPGDAPVRMPVPPPIDAIP